MYEERPEVGASLDSGPDLLHDSSNSERDKNCDQTEALDFRCLGCGCGTFRHYRDIRGRSQWECDECGALVEEEIDR